jgi:hypothetical protein
MTKQLLHDLRILAVGIEKCAKHMAEGVVGMDPWF